MMVARPDESALRFDHITVVARSLEEGSAYIKDTLGIDMPAGGSHPRMGTHNRLLSLGRDSFLELIAIDPDGTPPTRPRWFNLDAFNGDPILATWVLGTDDIQSDLRAAHPESGRATEITRGDLKWLISIADDGTMPMNGAFPTLIEWPEGPHPASRMTDLQCRLIDLTIAHPQAQEIEMLIGHRIDRNLIKIAQANDMLIRATIQTPSGTRTLT